MSAENRKMNATPLDLTALVGKEDRDLLVIALQALWRERVTCHHAVEAATIRKKMCQNAFLDTDPFGIDEVANMLRRVGAAPTPLGL